MKREGFVPLKEIEVTPKTKYGPIPESMYSLIEASGVRLADVWGISLDYREPLNPEKGNYYIGTVEKSEAECRLILGEEVELLHSLPGLPLAQAYAQRLEQLQESDLEKFREEGYTAVSAHEEAHRSQNQRLDARLRLLHGLEIMRTMGTVTDKDINESDDMFGVHHKAYLLTEVQALLLQCDFNNEVGSARHDFLVYWMSKTFRLFQEMDGKKVLESFYERLQDPGGRFNDVPGADALLSRALFLTRDPIIFDRIANRDITYEEFEKHVLKGLNLFLHSRDSFRQTLEESGYGRQLDQELSKALGELDGVVSG